jgi:ubiquinone/menaquinone biosynthesis C-methylase UbiE
LTPIPCPADELPAVQDVLGRFVEAVGGAQALEAIDERPGAAKIPAGTLSRGRKTVDELQLLIDLHRDGLRQGPGGDDETRLALALAGLRGTPGLRIADIGCGTGTSTLVLAAESGAQITAVDFSPEFLAVLRGRAERAGLAGRITTLAASMDALPFAAASYDAIWSEGAVYNMGFAAGIRAWREFLKPGGILAVSELSWFSARRPEALTAHWQREYPEVDTAAAKLAVLEREGYSPAGYFPLPGHCWLDNYYRPLQRRFPAFLDRHGHADAARAIVEAEENEIALYQNYSQFFGYGFYVARKVGD